tara:strand:- start:1672 stop:1947 length:276 start_codon:yes stop_codon:yes gene_type:complete
MKFSKKASKNKNFNVTNYNDEQRDFFTGLGFTERICKNLDGTIDRDYSSLSFHGSKIFGFWNDEEAEKIYKATESKFGKFKVKTLTTTELM